MKYNIFSNENIKRRIFEFYDFELFIEYPKEAILYTISQISSEKQYLLFLPEYNEKELIKLMDLLYDIRIKLKQYNFSTIDKMKNVIKINKSKNMNPVIEVSDVQIIEEIYEKNKKKFFDISVLSEYVKCGLLGNNELANIININEDEVNYYLNGDKLINVNQLNSLLKYFDCDKLYILKLKIKKKIMEEKIKEHDISFLKKYFIKNKIKQKKFAELVDINPYEFSEIINKRSYITDEQLTRIFNCFDVNSIEEIRKITDSNKIPRKLIKICNLGRLKNSVEDVSNAANEVAQVIFNEDDLNMNVDVDKMSLIISSIDFSDYDRRIAIVLFSSQCSKYTPLVVSEMFQVSLEHVSKIRSTCLKKYKDDSINIARMEIAISNINLDEFDKRIVDALFFNKTLRYSLEELSKLFNVSLTYIKNIKDTCMIEYNTLNNEDEDIKYLK